MAGKVVKQLAGSGTGQSLSDLMTAMKYTLSGSVVVKVICKATTEEMCAPKKKHLAYLVQCTFEPRLSVPDFANQLVNRTQHSNSVVVFKALLTIHHLMQYGNERFSQYIASNNCHFYVPSLHDRNNFQAHGIALFLRPYAKYLDEKAASYREVAFDFCRLKRGKDDSDMRAMPQDKLVKTLPVIEKQLDALLMFNATTSELSNSLLRVAHLFLYRDLIRLYAVYNEGMINLIGRYFTMSKRDCRISLDIYKNFIKRMEVMNIFVKIAESAEPGGTPLSLDSENSPFQPVPPSVLEALEQHLAYLEAHKQADKRITNSTSPKSQTNTTSRTDEIIAVVPPTAATASLDHSNSYSGDFVLTAEERQRIIEEERARLESFVSTARQHAFSSSSSDQQRMSNTSTDQQYYHSTDGDKFLDLVSFGETSTKTPSQLDNNTSIWSTSDLNEMNQRSTVQNSSNLSSEHNLLDLNDISTVSCAFGVNSTRSPKLFLSNQVSSSTTTTTALVPFLPSSLVVYPTNPFLINTTPQQLLIPTGISTDILSNQFPGSNTNCTGYTPSIKPASNAVQSSQSSISLDDKIAQIAGSLSIRDHYATSQGGRIYRAPDGSLSAVNWSGTMPCVQSSNNMSSQSTPQAPAPVHASSSMNQITGLSSGNTTMYTNPPVSSSNGVNNFTLNPTNPWVAITPQSLIP
ncbi:unnamed protein product [Heterobilharzia americana]|nr:unnamed protein product [Heterobilharzia americana]